MKNATTKNLVSIIIPAFNEVLHIEKCLKAIARQNYKNIEVILVDDFSSDNTGEVASKLAKKLDLKFNLISSISHKERGFIRTLGAKNSKGDYLLFIDADMQLEEKAVKECLAVITKNLEIGAVIIPEESIGYGFWSECRKLEKKCYLKDETIEAARFFKKEAFWKVGGWDDKMISGEDWDLTKRIREEYKIDRVDSKVFHDEGDLNIWKIAKKKFYYASKSGSYLKKYPLRITDLLFFIFRPAYFRNWKLLLSDPLHAIGMFVLKIIELMGGGLGYLYSKLPSQL